VLGLVLGGGGGGGGGGDLKGKVYSLEYEGSVKIHLPVVWY